MRRGIVSCLALVCLLALAGTASAQVAFSQSVPHPTSIWSFNGDNGVSNYRSCQIGIRQGPTNGYPLVHSWKVRSAATWQISVLLAITAQTAGDADAGTVLHAVLTSDVDGSVKGTAEVTYPVPTNFTREATGYLNAFVDPGVTYTLKLTTTGGSGRHYALGSNDARTVLAWDGFDGNTLHYLEGGTHNFAVNVNSGEQLNLTALFDASGADSPGYQQGGSFSYTVFDANMDVVVPTAQVTVTAGMTVPITADNLAAGAYIVQFVSSGHFYVQKNVGVDNGFYLMPCGGSGPVEQPQHLFHADYNMEWIGPRTSLDAILDGVYTFNYTWSFGILNDPNGPFTNPKITVTPAAGAPVGLKANPSSNLTSAVAPFTWSVPQIASNGSTWGSLFVQQPTPPAPPVTAGPYALGFNVARGIDEGREVPPGQSVVRTFRMSFTTHDPAITELAGNINFNGYYQGQQPGPVVASNATCSSPGSTVLIQDTPNVWRWQINWETTAQPIPAGSTFNLLCSVTLLNTGGSTASYSPAIVASAKRTAQPVKTTASSTSYTAPGNADPQDPLGTALFEVTGTGTIVAQLDARFTRTVNFNGINSLKTPTITLSNAPSVEEGHDLLITATVTDGGDPGNWRWMSNNGGTLTPTPCLHGETACMNYRRGNAPATVTVTLEVPYGNGQVARQSSTFRVTNLAPIIDPIADLNIEKGETMHQSGVAWDWGGKDWFTAATVNYGDGSPTETLPYIFHDGPPTYADFVLDHQYKATGVYLVTVMFKDSVGQPGFGRFTVNVFDPNAGFVTAGGFTDFAEGGRVSFGLNAKYLKGQATPSGQTEIQAQLAGANFHSVGYSSLVVFGDNSQYAVLNGTGTVNGSGNYTFRFTMIDGRRAGDGIDKVQLVVSDASGEVFRTPLTPLTQGNIVIHAN